MAYDATVLVGYEAERGRLVGMVAGAAAGQGGCMVLLGDPGVGKSTLCDEAASRPGTAIVLRARGLEHETPLAFAGLRDLLRPVQERISALPSPQAVALEAALALQLAPPGDRLALAAALHNLLSGAGRPVIVVVDDVQWLDRSSLGALAFVAHRIDDAPVVMLFAERGDQPQPVLRGLPVLPLGGLDLDEAAMLLEQAGHPVHPSVAERLWRDTAGNPLALVELAVTLPPAVLSGTQPLPGMLLLGPQLLDHFGARVAALPDPVRTALLVAAVAGSDAATLERGLVAAGLSWADLEASEGKGLVLIADGVVAFRHPLVRAAAYQVAPPLRRRQIHSLLAEVDGDPDRRAWHLAAAISGTDETVAAQLREAANRAFGRGGYAEAAEALQAAAAATADRSTRLDARIDAARAWHLGGSPDAALATLQVAMTEAEAPVGQSRVLEARGAIEMWLGRPRAARDVLRAEAERIEEADAILAARLRLLASMPSVMIGEVEAGRDLAAAAWPVLGDGPMAGLSAAALASSQLLLGSYQEGHRYTDIAVQALDEIPLDSQALPLAFLVVQTLSLAGRLVEAADLAHRVIEHGRRCGGPGLLALPLATLADVHWRQGSLQEARAAATEAVEICDAVGHLTERGHALAVRAQVEGTLGDAAARASAEQALGLAQRTGAAALEIFAHHALGLLALSQQHYDDAVVELQQARRLMGRHKVVLPSVVPWGPDLVEALVRSGQWDEAAEYWEELSVQLRALDSPWARSVALRCRGLLGGDAAQHALAEAVDVLPPKRSPFEGARTELVLGELLRRANRRQEAHRHLASAAGTFARLGAEPWAERARAELRAAGGRTPAPAERSLRALSAQELRIALRVAAGETNREVAAALYLSPKTVENTLTSVYAKLWVRSRTELTALVNTAK